jgi:putative DNA primase/helicase
MEPNDGKRFDESLLKLLTGGDSVPARHHYRATFQFTPQFKLAVGANHRVRITGTDEGIWDRIKQLPFTQRISDQEKDDDLRQKIVATELPGVLAWSVRGCVEWQRSGLGSCNAVELSTQDYRESQDTIGTFLEDCCLVGPQYWVSSENLMSAYTAWAGRTGEPNLSAKTLADRLRDRDHRAVRRGAHPHRQADRLHLGRQRVSDRRSRRVRADR